MTNVKLMAVATGGVATHPAVVEATRVRQVYVFTAVSRDL